MASLSEIRRERRAAYAELRKQSRKIELKVQSLKSQVSRILSRTTGVPDLADLDETYKKVQEVNAAVLTFVKAANQAETIMGI